MTAITNYDEVIVAKIKTCRSNFRSGGFDPWRSSDFDPYRSSSSIKVAVVSSFGELTTDQSDDSPRRVVG